MSNIATTSKKEYLRLEIKYPRVNSKDYECAWREIRRLGKKLDQLWIAKKNSFEILREERA